MLGNAVIINPDFSTKFHVNQYLNSPSVGNYEDFIIKEIIPFISEWMLLQKLEKTLHGWGLKMRNYHISGLEIKDYIKEKSMKDNLNDDEIKTLNIIGMSAFYSYNASMESGMDCLTGITVLNRMKIMCIYLL